MKSRIKFRMQCPFGGLYSIVDPLTNVQCQGTTFDSLMNAIYAQRKANGVPVGLGFENEVEQWVCAAYPAECEHYDPSMMKPRRMTLSDIIHGSRTMLVHWWNGRKLVSRELAEQRAQICLQCKFNVPFDKPCGGLCPELAEVVNAVIGQQGTQYDSQLKSCQVCGCFNQGAIWVEAATQIDHLPEEQKEQFLALTTPCWKATYLKETNALLQRQEG